VTVKLKRLGLLGVFVGAAVACVIVLFAAIALVDIPGLFGPWAQPRPTKGTNSCDASPTGSGFGTTNERRTATVAAWILGIREGAHAGWIKQIRDGAAISAQPGMKDWLALSQKNAADTNAAADRMTERLKIKRPAPFGNSTSGVGLDAFRNFVEAERQPAARGLAEAYSTRLCDVYKLGAYWGFSILYRAAAPTKGNVYAPEISFYAKRLEMPEEHVQAMLAASPAGQDSAQVQAASEQLSRRIAEYWSAK
jgi:hypothetical protein